MVKEEHCRACRPQNEYNLRVSRLHVNPELQTEARFMQSVRLSNASLSIYLSIRHWNEIPKCTLHVHRCIFAKFTIKTEVWGSRFASMTSLARFPGTSSAKSISQVFGRRELRQESQIDFLHLETKYSLQISYRTDSSAAFFAAVSLLPQHLHRAIRSIPKHVMMILMLLLLNAEWMQLCVEYRYRYGCRHSCRKRNVFSSKCRGGR